MTYLDPQAAGGGSNVTNLGETDMTSANTFDENGWPDDVQWFHINFWDVDMPNSAADITLRLYQGSASLVTTGYDSYSLHKDSVDTFAPTTSTIRFDVQGFGGTGLVRGHFHGRRADETSDIWIVHGFFMDDSIDEIAWIHGNVDLTSDLDGVRIQSANVGSFTAGNFSIQYGV